MGPEKAFFEFSNDNKILSEAIIYDFTGNKTNVKKLINESDGKWNSGAKKSHQKSKSLYKLSEFNFYISYH